MSNFRTITSFDPDDTQVPLNLQGPFLPVTRQDIDAFNDIFGEELDSSFTSSICCCDNCYDDFASHWPDTAYRNIEFQEQGMERDWFIDYSRIGDVYSPVELSTLRNFVTCPRCYGNITYNFWAYEHKFDDSNLLENQIDELLNLSRKTPFLLLKHELSQKILSAINSVAGSCHAEILPDYLYRSRTLKSVAGCGQDSTQIETYSPAPPKFVEEGRFNHAGEPMLYLADTFHTALAEIGVPGQDCCVASLQVTSPLKVLDLVELNEMADEFDLLEAIARSSLLSAPRTGEGWVKKQYVFSRFVADCAKAAGFDAIRYGSTKSRSGSNYVLLSPPPTLEDFASLKQTQITLCPPSESRI